MTRFLIALVALCLPLKAAAQDFLSQAEVEQVLSLNAFCYAQGADGSCAWAEVYPVLDGPLIELNIGVVLGPGQLVVLRQRATWINDAMCIRDGDLGVTGSSVGPPPIFPFDGAGLVPQAPATTNQIIAQIAASTAPKTCFRFARDPARPGGLLQITFADSVQLDGADPITLVPLSQRSVQLTIPF
ncbi:hypothetical protein V8J82_18925 [Gymnodinialimonas sp. 2305UL16-5]|uniref:hypothetical protein n=1 Tax=Gymnodinialimonas mytili TaxID=3126503 RepID=UPI0030A28201